MATTEDEFFTVPVNPPISSSNNNVNTCSSSKSSSPTPASSTDSPKSSTDNIYIQIVDAQSDTNNNYFFIQTKTSNKKFKQTDFKVKRTHEDFKWLYQQIADNCENYAGYLVPSPPGKPDFSNSFVHNEKYNFAVAQMSRYGSGIGGENTHSYGNNKINRKRSDSSASGVSSVSSLRTQTSTDTTNKLLEKLKKNCESEYLASFKKCVTDHETFLIKICNHQLFRTDVNLQHFLESDNFENYKLLTTGKNKKNPFSSFLNKVVQYSDEQIFRTTPHRGSLMNRSLDSSHTSGVSSLRD